MGGKGTFYMDWFALYVKSRHEFITNGELNKKGIETFLPSVKKMRQWKDRKKFIDFPIFPGYLFTHIYPDNKNFFSILNTRGAVKIISSEPGIPAPIPLMEIESLKLLIESGTGFDIYPHLKEGTRVRVIRGPLKGAEGMLKEKGDNYTFLVNIELLGRGIGVKINADCVENA